MGYQKGDGIITVAGQNYGLRLTMGALAELDTRLSLSGPTALATRFKQASREEASVLLAAEPVSYTHLTLPTIYSV